MLIYLKQFFQPVCPMCLIIENAARHHCLNGDEAADDEQYYLDVAILAECYKSTMNLCIARALTNRLMLANRLVNTDYACAVGFKCNYGVCEGVKWCLRRV